MWWSIRIFSLITYFLWDVMLCSLAEEIYRIWKKKVAGSSKMCVCICQIIQHYSDLRSHCCAESRSHRTLSLHHTHYLKERCISPAQVIFLLCLFQPTSCQSFSLNCLHPIKEWEHCEYIGEGCCLLHRWDAESDIPKDKAVRVKDQFATC
jgi:hypothetical protein